ncbi:MAG: hypothetical protein DMG88_20615, partial [Acidobacteria bacterium]
MGAFTENSFSISLWLDAVKISNVKGWNKKIWLQFRPAKAARATTSMRAKFLLIASGWMNGVYQFVAVEISCALPPWTTEHDAHIR